MFNKYLLNIIIDYAESNGKILYKQFLRDEFYFNR